MPKTKKIIQPRNKKAALYVRVSTVYQLDKDSLPIQRQDLINYSKLVLGIDDYEIFEDAGYSGKNTIRPMYQLMMQRIRDGEFSHLLVWKIDRISRNLLDFASMYAELKALHVTFVSKNEQFDTSTAMGEAMLKIILVFAELERAMTSERVSSILATRAENGEWNGGRVPYGYIKNPELKTFEINPDEAEIVRLIYDKYIESSSLTIVTRYLNSLFIPSKSGKSWNLVGVHKILTNIWYIGDYKYVRKNNISSPDDESNTIITKNHHPALIDDMTFQTVQKMMASKNRQWHGQKHNHALSGLLTCAECGDSYNPIWVRGKIAYRCYSKTRETTCKNRVIHDSVILPLLLNYASNLINAKKRSFSNFSQFEKYLLIGDGINLVKGIDGDIKESYDMLSSEIIPFEFVLQAPTSTLADIVNSQKSKHLMMMNRLENLLINGLMTVEDYQTRKAEEEQALEILSQTIIPESDTPLPDENEKTSYLLLYDFITNHKNFTPFVCDTLQGTDVLKNFLHTIFDEIYIKKGKISKIVFKNGITHEFYYKELYF